MPASISSGTYVPMPPAFCSHLPMFSPMMFRNTATKSRKNDPTIRNARFCARNAPPLPADVRAPSPRWPSAVPENKKTCRPNTSSRRRIREIPRTPLWTRRRARPRSGNRVESSAITNVVGRKKNIAASTHRLIEDVPLCAAAAIHRGPSTDATLKSSTSQNPITRRSWLLGIGVQIDSSVTRSASRAGINASSSQEIAQEGIVRAFKFRPRAEEGHAAFVQEISRGRPAFSPGAYRASPRWRSCAASPSISQSTR